MATEQVHEPAMIHHCGLVLDGDTLCCPCCGEYLDARLRHIDEACDYCGLFDGHAHPTCPGEA